VPVEVSRRRAESSLKSEPSPIVQVLCRGVFGNHGHPLCDSVMSRVTHSDFSLSITTKCSATTNQPTICEAGVRDGVLATIPGSGKIPLAVHSDSANATHRQTRRGEEVIEARKDGTANRCTMTCLLLNLST
jgi:hypothetical protein